MNLFIGGIALLLLRILSLRLANDTNENSSIRLANDTNKNKAFEGLPLFVMLLGTKGRSHIQPLAFVHFCVQEYNFRV